MIRKLINQEEILKIKESSVAKPAVIVFFTIAFKKGDTGDGLYTNFSI